jgi:Phage tail assembly chaperone proteins, E, or 41 or 14
MDAKTEQTGPVADKNMNDEPNDEVADFESTGEDTPPPELDFEHTLAKPIQAHGEEIKVLRWREPTGGDIERAGNPVYLDVSAVPTGGAATMTFNEKKMAGMISVLCQIPPSSVRQMTSKDWNAVAWKLFRFFTPPGL